MAREPSTADAAQVVAALSLEDEVRLLSGRDAWHLQPVPQADLPGVMVTDGPHGLRRQRGDADHLGLADVEPATCFPTAATLGATWDEELLVEVGRALGREAAAAGVAVVLGPGLNLKRHPGGGRNFEYLSEDPLVAGRLAAALARGIQAAGVGACPKHLAANHQETSRMVADTVVDERTLRELELTAFELAVRGSAPWAVMHAYNRLNGTYCGEDRWLLTDVLRDEWGFDGLVVSDWGAVADRVAGVRAGCDLEMPGSRGAFDDEVVAAVRDGRLAQADVDRCAIRVVELLQRAHAAAAGRGDLDAGADGASTATADRDPDAAGGRGDPAAGADAHAAAAGRDDPAAGGDAPDAAEPGADLDAHHALARRAAAAGTVLLTNDGILPLEPTGTIAVVGAFATTPRYQGAGSSQVLPTRLDDALTVLRERVGDAATVIEAPAYDAATGATTDALVARAVEVAAAADVAVVFAGLPGSAESEGFDRRDLALPAGHTRVLEAVLDANPRTVVVLSNGAPVELPWADRPAALVEGYLGGQAGGAAIVDVLVGDAEPGGRLAESFPVRAADLPADAHVPGHPKQVKHREGLAVGYRFHDTAGVPARFPFGHGLGYTSFALHDLEVTGAGSDRTVTVTVTNTGDRAGAEVVQLYVRDVEASVPRPAKELRAFAKVHLDAGASRSVALPLDRRAFAVWDVTAGAWLVEAGTFELLVGRSSVDLPLRATVEVASDDVLGPSATPVDRAADDAGFAAALGRPVPTPAPVRPFHRSSAVADLGATLLGRLVQRLVLRGARRQVDQLAGDDDATRRMFEASVLELPLRTLVLFSGGRPSFRTLDTLLDVLNGRPVAAVRRLASGPRR